MTLSIEFRTNELLSRLNDSEISEGAKEIIIKELESLDYTVSKITKKCGHIEFSIQPWPRWMERTKDGKREVLVFNLATAYIEWLEHWNPFDYEILEMSLEGCERVAAELEKGYSITINGVSK